MDRALGDRFKEARLAKDWTQRELADRVGLSERTIQRFEEGKFNKRKTYSVRRTAKELGIDLDELQQLHQDEIAFPTLQTPETAAARDEATTPAVEETAGTAISATPVLTETPRGTKPTRTWKARNNRWLVLSLSIMTVAVVLIAGIAFWALVGKDIYNTISGQVTCPNNQPVVGVWIDAVNGGSDYATKQFVNRSESVVRFTYTLPNGGAYNLHVGCGGTSKNWGKSYRTEDCSGTIEDRAFHAFTLYDQPPADRRNPCLVRYG